MSAREPSAATSYSSKTPRGESGAEVGGVGFDSPASALGASAATALAPDEIWCKECQGVYGRRHAKVSHRQAGPFGWRDWPFTHRVVSQMYVLGLISGSGTQSTGSGWRLIFVHWRGARPYILGMPSRSWGRVPLWHRLRFGHWPETVYMGVCGVCAPWPCCGATGFDHLPGCGEELHAA